MKNKLFVGNIAWAATLDGLQELFGEYGQVVDSVILTDRETGKSRGCGFVTMSTVEEAQKAQKELDGSDFLGRKLNVVEARPKENR